MNLITLFLAASLTWDPLPTTSDVAGYDVHYGADASSATAHVDVGNAVTVQINAPGYYTVTGRDTAGKKSKPSNQVMYAAAATPTPAPGISVAPPAPQFTGMAGGPRPAAIVVKITTANGAGWKSADTCAWYNAFPTSGASGSTQTLSPSIGWDALAIGTHSCPIVYSASGLPNKTLLVSGTKQPIPIPTPTPAATPTPAPTPAPTPVPTPTPAPTPASTMLRLQIRAPEMTGYEFQKWEGMSAGDQPGEIMLDAIYVPVK